MAVFTQCTFAMAGGLQRDFIVREDAVWQERNRRKIQGEPSRPAWMLSNIENRLRNAPTLPDDRDFISASEVPLGTTVHVEDWEREQNLILRADADGFRIIQVAAWPAPANE